jgi:hypothetical protein
MTDEGGVLGNLPNSRPGKRSAKRDRPAKTAAKAAAAGKAGPKARPPVDRAPQEPGDDPVGAVVRTAAGIAVTGARVAGAVTQELLRRLPRP